MGLAARKIEPVLEQVSGPRLMTAPFSLILSFYVILPVLVLTVAVDYLFFENRLKQSLPFAPEEVTWLMCFFNVPHIVASSLLFLDTKYMSRYYRGLSVAIIVITASVYLLPIIIGEPAFYAIAVFVNIRHIIGQQLSLAKLRLKRVPPAFRYWHMLGTLLGVILFVALSLDVVAQLFPEFKISPTLYYSVHAFMIVCLIACGVFSYYVSLEATDRLGKAYVWANFSLLVITYLLTALEYPFFAILAPRFVHDLSAFVFYTSHNHNRNLETPKNYFFKLFSFSRLPSFILTPLTAIGLSVPIVLYCFQPDQPIQVYFVLSTLHFYTEYFAWKKGSLLRNHIRLT